MKTEGRNAVIELLKTGKNIDKLLLEKGAQGSLGLIFAEARRKNIRVQFVDKQVLDKESETRRHQGVIAFTTDYEYYDLDDIIAEKKGTVAFVEVKTRHENPLTRPFEAVDTKKQEKIYRTSLAYIYENDLDCQYRFDVCEVYVNRDTLKLIQINYFDNAFIPESDNGYY